jgi:excisionase family DNA binding protein
MPKIQQNISKPMFLRVSRVAQILDISRPSVYDLIRNGDLAGVIRVGSRMRVPQRAVDDLIKRGVVA